MSTTTVSVRSSAEDARIEEVRRRESEAREAARRAAQRAARIEEERRRDAEAREAERRRLDAANRMIAEQEVLFQREVSRLDEATRRLPDLSLQAPSLPGLASSDASDPAKVEAYAAGLATAVAQFGRQLDAAIVEAERLLKRRIAKAAAWRNASDLERQSALRMQASREVAARLQVQVSFAPMPENPGAEAELEGVEAYVAAVRQALQEIDRQYASLMARDDARKRAAALGGAQVQTRSASEAQDRHETERMAAAQAGLKVVIGAALTSAGMRMEGLSQATRFLVEDAIAHAHTFDRSEQVTRWIAREKQRRDGVERALALMQSAPDMVHEDAALSHRWASLLGHLQLVAGGLEEFTPNLDREYEQICADARRNLNAAFTKADFLHALSEVGLVRLGGEDGQGFVVVDLDHPEVWLEATELESEKGDFGAVLEIKTDMEPSPAIEAAITAHFCDKLGKVAGASAPKVQTQAEVIERKDRITRGRRPAEARKAFAQKL